MSRYSNIPVIKNSKGKQLYQTTRYPEIPRSNSDLYVYTTVGDRFDTLAQQYYGDSSLWWVIANANNLEQDSLTPPEGTQIRIPASPVQTLTIYENLNPPTLLSNTEEGESTTGISGGSVSSVSTGGGSGGGY